MLTIKLLMLHSRARAFTIAELLIVIVVISLLAAISTIAYTGTTQRSVNTQLMTDLTEASDLLETEYIYKKKYPALASEANSGAGLKLTPGTNVNYIVGSVEKEHDWFCLEATSNTSGTKQYFLVTGTTLAEGSCPAAPSIQLSEGPATPQPPIVNASPAGASTTWTWEAAICNLGTASYEYIHSDNNFSGAAVTTTGTSVVTSTPTDGHTYMLQVRAKCVNGADSSGWSSYGSESYTRTAAPVGENIPAVPANPVVAASTSGTTTNWTWGAATCNLGTAKYEYTYTTSASASPAVLTTNTAVSFNTSTQGYTYTVKVRARCENGTDISGWSGYGSKAYARPVTNTIQIAGGSNSMYAPDPDNYQIHGRATVNSITGSCASGTKAVARYRTQLNNNSWINRGSYVNYGSGWTVYYDADMDLGASLEFSFYARCHNATTGVYGPDEYSDAYGNLNVTQNRAKPTRGTWSRTCGGHNSNPVQAGWCTADNYTFVAFP